MSWKEVVIDPDEVKVFMAMDGPEYTWRTIRGISRQTGVDEATVRRILDKYNTQLTRQSITPSASGSPLVGLLEKVGG